MNYNLIAYTLLFIALERALNVDIRIFALTPDIFLKRSNFWSHLLLSYILMLLVVYALPKEFKRPSDIFLHIQFIFPVLPMLILFSHFELPFIYLISVVISLALILLIINLNTSGLNLQKYRRLHINATTMAYICLALTLGTILYTLSTGVGVYFNLDFDKVYEFRSDISSSLPGIAGYLIAFVTKVITPTLGVLGIVLRKYILTFLSIILSILLFGLTSHKAVLFYPIIGILIHIFFSRLRLYMMATVIAGLAALSLIGLKLGSGFEWIYFLLIDRTIYVPSAINFAFYDWFSNEANNLVLWSDSKITFGLMQPRYSLPTTSLIGLSYFGDERIIANTGWIGSGVSHFGLTGLFLYATLMGLIFRILDKNAIRLGPRLVTSLSLSALVSPMLSTDLPNGFLTHGVLVALTILYFIKTEAQVEK